MALEAQTQEQNSEKAAIGNTTQGFFAVNSEKALINMKKAIRRDVSIHKN